MTLRRLHAAAEQQGWVLSRAQLRTLGVDRWQVRRLLAAGVWRAHGLRTIGLTAAQLDEVALRHRAVWESGRVSALDGVSALQHAGLTGWHEPTVHISVPHGRSPIAVTGVSRHVVPIRGDLWEHGPDQVIAEDLPWVRSELAVLRAAQWAISDRAAALVIAMAVQQRLVATDLLARTLPQAGLYRRRKLIRTVVADVIDGAQALGELDFGAACRRHGLPPPARQVIRRGPHGRIYLDAGWPRVRLFVEIDGAHHQEPANVLADALRQNSVVVGGETVLRIPLLGLRIQEDAFMQQVVTAYRLRAAGVSRVS
ncbi:hypothetical protein HJ588_00920 [Flexivirga sp. ID2601S]|uniref:DUF559 domain-containing protein n=1 Tax=Flexivirga aerilata TaxID=1656889 RepID=A0A849AD51_9MICO|nr:hypothetical protein [Flexivirga aerilata]NNG37837.1 hypothetical protein [Flexivirga aerilata]